MSDERGRGTICLMRGEGGYPYMSDEGRRGIPICLIRGEGVSLYV